MPPVSSRTTKMSRPPSRISAFRGEAPARASKIMAGRRLAKRPSSLRRPRRARSGRSPPGRVSHLGPPTAPSSTASAALHTSMVSWGRQLPTASMAQPPARTSWQWKLWPNFPSILWSTSRACSTISGPMPSPRITASFASMAHLPPFWMEAMRPPAWMISLINSGKGLAW